MLNDNAVRTQLQVIKPPPHYSGGNFKWCGVRRFVRLSVCLSPAQMLDLQSIEGAAVEVTLLVAGGLEGSLEFRPIGAIQFFYAEPG